MPKFLVGLFCQRVLYPAYNGRSSGVALIDPERYLEALESDQDFDLFELAIVRITGFNEQLEFELKHVPDGAYAIIAYQEVIDAQGNREDVGILKGINALTGGVDSTALVQVVDGQKRNGFANHVGGRARARSH